MKDPAFLFYSSDFLSGVSDLTMEERGQYITLLCIQHQKGVLTEKTIRLLVGSCSVDVLNKFTKDSDGNYYNERLKIESEKRNKFTESRRNNGLKGGRPIKSDKPSEESKNNLEVNHMGSHMGNEDEIKDCNSVFNTNKGENENFNRSLVAGEKEIKEIAMELAEGNQHDSQREAIMNEHRIKKIEVFKWALSLFNRHKRSLGQLTSTHSNYSFHLNNWLRKQDIQAIHQDYYQEIKRQTEKQ
jgi:hypothetical protein